MPPKDRIDIRRPLDRPLPEFVAAEFDSYRLAYYALGKYPRVTIWCFKGNVQVGQIEFREQSVLGAPLLSTVGPVLFYPLEQFNDIITILRYEKPLYLYLWPNLEQGGVSTSEQEPVGEQE